MYRSTMKLALALIAVAGLFAARATAADDNQADAKKLIGTWRMVQGEKGGEPAPPQMLEKFRITFKEGGKVTVALPDGRNEEHTFEVDAAKNPKELTFKAGEGKEIRAIYAFD